MTLADLAEWLEAEKLGIYFRKLRAPKSGWTCGLSDGHMSIWEGTGASLDTAIDVARASYWLRDCTGLPEVREVDGTCL